MLLLVTPPDTAVLPVILDEVKAHLGIVGNAQDARLTDLIWGATDLAEQWTGRTFCVQTFALTLPRFSKQIEIPRPPLATIDFVKFYNASNVLQTMDAGNYRVVKSDFNNFVEFIDLPQTYLRADAVQIEFTTDAIQPYLFPAAVKLIVGHLNENREGQAFPDGIMRLLGLMRDGRYS